MRVLLFVAVIAALAVAEANTQAQPNDGYFHFFNFIKKYGKVYTMDEFQTRFQIFQNNMVIAASLNERDTATYGNSPFMDLTPEEFRATYLMNKMPKTEAPGDLCVPKAGTVPATKNWVTEGKTTPVKDQGQCGSCWAFSVTENVESVWMIGGNKQIALAPQQIVDCDTKNFGCQGGWPYYAFEYIMGAGGMESEASYPYTAETEPCTFNKTKVAAEISSYCYLTKTKDEEQMRKFIGTTAPPSVCVDASSWQFYSGGVLSQCTQNIDHCVQAVGYGHDESSGLDYWLLRNSWGQGWGESGFLRITRNADTCAVAELATSAIL